MAIIHAFPDQIDEVCEYRTGQLESNMAARQWRMRSGPSFSVRESVCPVCHGSAYNPHCHKQRTKREREAINGLRFIDSAFFSPKDCVCVRGIIVQIRSLSSEINSTAVGTLKSAVP